ncbi:MAG: gliding motility-associated C-terminal domain-containing protein [Saprospiraceae bacterium]
MRTALYLCNFLLSLVLPNLGWAQTNEGTTFWCGFMEHLDVNQNTKVAMITSKYSTSGTVSMPLMGWSQTFSVAANGVSLVTLPVYAETLGSEAVTSTGILIVSNDPVSVYIHQYFGMRSEATVVLPTNSIGNEYFMMTYEGVNRNGTVYPAEFLVVATQDDTNLSITVSDNTKQGRQAGTSFNIKLNTGQTYQVQAALGSGDLTGSYIKGDKDFTVFAGNKWTEVPHNCDARDNLLEQMYPLSTWGKIFVTVPNDKVAYDVFRVLASEDNTKVEVQENNSNRNYNLNRGQFVEYPSSKAAFISANKPIMVAQFNVGSGCNGHTLGDPSMVILNSAEQTRDTVTLYNSGFQNISENYINIISQTSDFDQIIFDGNYLMDLGITQGMVGPNNQFSYTRISVSDGAHTIISQGCGVIATAYGYGNVESYAYSGGASFSEINANPIPEGGCLNDTIFFDTGLSPARFSFSWDLGDGTKTNLPKFEHFYDGLGEYPVTLILTDNCLSKTDTLNRDLLVSLRQAVDASDLVEVCEGEEVQLSATDLDGARYEWQGPLNYFSEAQFPKITRSKPQMSGDYEVIGIVSGCATFPAYTPVIIHPAPLPDLGPDTLFCSRDFVFTLDPGDFNSYRWQDNSTADRYEVLDEGTYAVTVTTAYGCENADEVLLVEQCPTKLFVPNIFSPNDDHINDTFGPFATDIIRFRMKIFDRWGNLVFESFDLEQHWNGEWRNQPAPMGVYVWFIEMEGYLRDGSTFSQVKSGSVTLVR